MQLEHLEATAGIQGLFSLLLFVTIYFGLREYDLTKKDPYAKILAILVIYAANCAVWVLAKDPNLYLFYTVLCALAQLRFYWGWGKSIHQLELAKVEVK